MDLVFGPVPSRRLGLSLGIDPIPFKTCSWNCVYCQLGRTGSFTAERKVYVPEQEILQALDEVLARNSADGIDWISFVGSGEPTLHSGIGRLIEAVKTRTTIPVAVITNGSLLDQADVRRDLLRADAVMPSLSAGSEKLFRKIHRPLSPLTLAKQLDGLRAFREEYGGPIWIEVMLLAGLNDSEEALTDLARALESGRPDEVHLLLPDRPPSLEWVRPTDEEGVMRATAILGARLKVVHPQHGRFDRASYRSLAEAIVAVVTRHPMREAELARMLAGNGEDPSALHDELNELARRGVIQPVTRFGDRFWGPAEARY